LHKEPVTLVLLAAAEPPTINSPGEAS